jgi:hypothetical protein
MQVDASRGCLQTRDRGLQPAGARPRREDPTPPPRVHVHHRARSRARSFKFGLCLTFLTLSAVNRQSFSLDSLPTVTSESTRHEHIGKIPIHVCILQYCKLVLVVVSRIRYETYADTCMGLCIPGRVPRVRV